MRVPAAVALLFVLAGSLAAQTPQKHHVIQGRITSDSGAVADADVIVTIAPTAETVLGKSDAAGNYHLAITNPTGEYIVNISALGYRPFRQRVTITAVDSTVTVNTKLARNVQQVAGVRVSATRPRPPRSLGNDAGFGGDPTNKTVDGVTNALPPELQGNFDAMAALIPGYSAIPGGGFSAFGLGADANMKQVNGMNFSGDAVPRDLGTQTKYVSSPWDPTKGGFSGALASTTINRGSNIDRGTGRITLDAPPLQVTDRIAERFGQKYTNLQLGGGRNGAFSLDRYFYNTGYSASVIRAPVSSLLDFDADALAHAGIAPDSAFKLTQILGAQHVPLTTGGIPDQRTTFSGNFGGRFDFALPNPPAGQTPPPTWNIVTLANYSQTRASSLTPTALPATTGVVSTGGAQLQGLYSRFFGAKGDYVNEMSLGGSFNETRGTPYLELPSGNVLVASAVGGATAIGNLSFGGNSAFARDSRSVAVEVNNQTTMLLRDLQSLPASIYIQSRYEHFDQSLSANRLGSFSYASLSDLTANKPSSFSRTLNAGDRSGGEWMGAAAMGVNYNTQKWVVTGGARVDANRFIGLPDYNPDLERTFGIRNDRAPNSIAVSPRVGFSWFPLARGPLQSVFITPGALQVRGGPAIRGGIGEFRNFLRSDLLSDAIGTTGLPGTTQRLICTGPAAPIPDWAAYMQDPSSVPSTCAGGSPVFADTARTALMVDPSFRPMHSWRGTLGFTQMFWENYVAVDGTYSLNLNQPGTLDLNFAGAPKFTLSSEGNRPVFVSQSSIVGSTGSVSAVESRRSPAFSRVTDRVSDLKGDTKQVTAYLLPNIPLLIAYVSVGYTYSDARAQARGFDASTSTDPRAIEWAPVATQPKHQVILQTSRSLNFWRLWGTVSTKFQSGLRYTPVVAGDINGDGWSGDRAFIFDPARTTDTAVARGMRDLLTNGSHSARDCLTKQLGTIAGRNSCLGPWTANMNASILAANFGKENRYTLTLNLANPLAGIDQLLHGADNLHGWGSTPFADGTLYQVRGFDATAQRFNYQVNPRFGNTNPALTTFRTPFRLTLDFRMALGGNVQEQAVMLNMRIKPPLKDTRATADTIKTRYVCGNGTGANGYSDIYQRLLQFADSLALSRDQVEKLQARQKQMRAAADSLYGSLAEYLHALPQAYDVKDAAKHVTDTELEVWKRIYGEAPFLRELLTSGQMRLLGNGPMYSLITTTKPNYNARFYSGSACR